MLLGLVSAKGSPGVTTAALALTAVAVDGGLLVELDPSGGSIECWTGAAGEPGLVRVASGLRRAVDPITLLEHAVEVPPGVRSILSPAAGSQAESTIAMTGDRLTPALGELDTTVVIDGGRWARSQPTAHRVSGCDVVAVVCAPTVDGIEAARWLLEPLGSVVTGTVAVVLAGERPYSPEEVAAVVDAPVAGALAWDPRSAAALVARGAAGRGWSRTPLARSARSLLTALHELAGEASVVGRA